VGAQRRCDGRNKPLYWAHGGAVLGAPDRTAFRRRPCGRGSGGRSCAGLRRIGPHWYCPPVGNGRRGEHMHASQGCDGSVHIGIVHLPYTEGNQHSSATIRHAIRHAMAPHQACNQPTLGSRHWSASLVSARWGWNETRRGEHLHAGRGLGGNQHAWMIRIESKWRM